MNGVRFCAFTGATLFWLLCLGMMTGTASGLTVEMEGERLRVQNGSPKNPMPSEAIIRELGAPSGGGFRTRAESLEFRLDAPLEDRGTVAFWFRTDRPQSTGIGAQRASVPLVSVKGLVDISFHNSGNEISIEARWNNAMKGAAQRNVQVLMPQFPGPEWHHFALVWDASKGILNAYVDGSPFYWASERIPAWKSAFSDRVTLHPGVFALADIRVDAECLDGDTIQKWVGPERAGALDKWLGAAPLGPLDVSARKGKLLYGNSLSRAADVSGWKMEGPGILEFDEGWMTMRSERPDGPEGHTVFWCPVDFPESFVAEWEFERLGADGLCIVFFAAKGQGGRDLFDPSLRARDGRFGQYVKGDIDCYHISYYADTPLTPRRTTNLRKNSGFYLVASGPSGVRPGATGVHRITLLKEKGLIQLAVDGVRIIDFADDDKTYGLILGSGKIGFRQMQWTQARYRNFEVYQLK